MGGETNILKAGPGLVNEVLALVKAIKEDMQANGITQWNEVYPKDELFVKDIEAGHMWVARAKERIVGIITLSPEQDKEYLDMEWEDEDGRFLVVHRLGIHPGLQRKGLAGMLMDLAEEHAKSNGYSSIRLDTYSDNYRSIAFYEKRGYRRRPGHVHFIECPGPFYCYEKMLHRDR